MPDYLFSPPHIARNIVSTLGAYAAICRELGAAIAAGKHVFCEKPVGRSAEDTVQIARAAAGANITMGTGFNYRWAPLIQHARSLIQQGKLGDLTHYRGRFFSMYGSNPMGLLSWRFDSAISGYGVVGDLMSHVVDMAHMMVGPMKRVSSQSHTFIPERPQPIPGEGTHYSVGKPGDPKGEVSNEDYVGTLVEFRNGVRGVIEAYEFLQSVLKNRKHTPGFEEALAVANVSAAMVRSWNSGMWEEIRF